MTDTGYTPDPALVELVAEALGARRNGPASGGRGWFRTEADRVDCYSDAAAVLSALAAAGHLPDEIEWGWRGYSEQEPQRGMPLRDETAAREVVAQHPGTELVRRWIGPWLPVPTPPQDHNEKESHGIA